MELNDINFLRKIPTSLYHPPIGLSNGWTINVTIVMCKNTYSLRLVQFLKAISYNLTVSIFTHPGFREVPDDYV